MHSCVKSCVTILFGVLALFFFLGNFYDEHSQDFDYESYLSAVQESQALSIGSPEAGIGSCGRQPGATSHSVSVPLDIVLSADLSRRYPASSIDPPPSFLSGTFPLLL